MADDELDETTFPAWRDAIAAHAGGDVTPRSYPGYRRVVLPTGRPRRFAMSLERALASRRSAAALADAPVTVDALARVLRLGHGVTGDHARGPTPSAGGLQALELYLASWHPGPLAPGWYHYDRRAHALAEIAPACTRTQVAAMAPSLVTLSGGAVLLVVVGDHARVEARYTRRAARFLALEAGHLLQSVALAAVSGDLVAIPLGGYFERAIARTLQLPRSDRVLATAVLGLSGGR